MCCSNSDTQAGVCAGTELAPILPSATRPVLALPGLGRFARPSVLDCLTPGHRELAETILDSGDTLLTILGDILDFSKIDHNRMTLESAPVGAATKLHCPCLATSADPHLI